MAAAADGSPWSVACAGLGAAGRRAFGGLLARPPAASHWLAAVCLGTVCVETVSYTHLTLPTILLV